MGRDLDEDPLAHALAAALVRLTGHLSHPSAAHGQLPCRRGRPEFDRRHQGAEPAPLLPHTSWHGGGGGRRDAGEPTEPPPRALDLSGGGPVLRELLGRAFAAQARCTPTASRTATSSARRATYPRSTSAPRPRTRGGCGGWSSRASLCCRTSSTSRARAAAGSEEWEGLGSAAVAPTAGPGLLRAVGAIGEGRKER